MGDPILTPTDIADFRQVIEDIAMPDTFEVLRKVTTNDGMGGTTFTEAVTSTGPCDLQTITGSRAMRATTEQVKAGQLLVEVPYLVNLPPTTDLAANDRLRINGTRLLEVLGVISAGTWDLVMTASCKEVL